MTGLLHVDDIRDLLHHAMLGLSRMMIYTVISEGEVNADNKIAYASYIPRAVGLIRSMLSFEKSVVRDQREISAEAEDSFFLVLDEAFAGMDVLPIDDFMSRLETLGLVEGRELQAARHLLAAYGEDVNVGEATSQLWSLVKSMRRHTSS